uniref:Uncharacterized protein n=1 Tax=Noctiluca scintillans TaxID=2966 RepID=A0A7S1F7D2_NOCSC|mmetsp:Transcript_40396/g.107116  ORF Transcript_40396/g.107116 Transcript_40396/m.107116 type:complete len:245 (+) Transcript_40396:112-846(+)
MVNSREGEAVCNPLADESPFERRDEDAMWDVESEVRVHDAEKRATTLLARMDAQIRLRNKRASDLGAFGERFRATEVRMAGTKERLLHLQNLRHTQPSDDVLTSTCSSTAPLLDVERKEAKLVCDRDLDLAKAEAKNAAADAEARSGLEREELLTRAQEAEALAGALSRQLYSTQQKVKSNEFALAHHRRAVERAEEAEAAALQSLTQVVEERKMRSRCRYFPCCEPAVQTAHELKTERWQKHR